ncbi:lamin tail domain-containing protein [Candidatus Bipolaricaulota bacterium]|nr:lamin tail domain-containing protein [Candidatus Bipolaricaulota bacterium]
MTRKLFLIAIVVLMAGGGVVAQTCSVQSYFVSPDVDGVIETAIIQAIDGARKSLDIALFSFTDDQLGDAVVRATRRGVSVRVILGAGQDKVFGGEYEKLVSANIPVAIANTPGFFHHKFAVIDGNLLITGSYDWSDSADKENYENVVFISCPLGTAGQTASEQYTREFDRLWEKLRVETGNTSGEPVLSAAVHPVIIYIVDPAGECIELLNVSTTPVDIGGWRLSDLEGSYSFPPDTLINPDEPYQVCIDTYNPTYDPEGLYLNDEHDEVFLITPEGTIIDERIWGEPQTPP